jgi:hypothetical protein
MSLYEELIEYSKNDEEIVKTFHPKSELCPDIFNSQNGSFILKPDIRKKLIEISDHFMETLGVEFFIHDIHLTGSLSNYNWSKYSDVDLHIVIDFENTNYNHSFLKEFFDAKKEVWNKNHNVKIKNFDVEVYIQDNNEKHISSGVFSVLNNKWLIEPKKETPNIDDRKILDKGEEYAKKIDKMVSLSKKKDMTEEISLLRKKIKSFRQSGLESGGEHSYENLVFKLLRRNGYIKKLFDLRIKLIDKKLSLKQ